MTQRKPWTDLEVQQLQEHYNRGAEMLLVLLLGRPWTAIRAKAQKLGVLQEKRTTWKTCPTCQRTLLRAANFYERSNGRRGTRTESRCKDCCTKIAKDWVNSTPERRAHFLERQRRRHERTRDKQLEYMRQHNRRMVDRLEPRYVALTLGLRLEQTPEALLEAKREQLTLRRLARQLKKATNESSKDTDAIPGEHGRRDDAGRSAPDRGQQPAGAGQEGDQRHGRGSDGQGAGLDQQQSQR